MHTCFPRRLHLTLSVILLAAMGCAWSVAAQAATTTPHKKATKTAKTSKAKVRNTHPAEAAAMTSAAKHRTASLQGQTTSDLPPVSGTTNTPTTPPSAIGKISPPIPLNTKSMSGKASFYSSRFEGLKTATGETFSHRLLTAASNVLPLGTLVAVRRPGTNLCVVVKINDRMHPRHHARVIDLTYTAARYLSMLREGVVQVQISQVPQGATAGNTISCPTGEPIEEGEAVEGLKTDTPAPSAVSCKNCATSIPMNSAPSLTSDQSTAGSKAPHH